MNTKKRPQKIPFAKWQERVAGLSPKHAKTKIIRDDGTTLGYRCTCGGHWKVYQNPYHQTA